jgi:lipoprotein-anchoring transpeptidase ErfK/SrfK
VNTLKPLLIAAVLAGIGYGVYVRINGGNNGPPPGAPDSWDVAPKVELPDVASASPAPAWPSPASVAATPAPANAPAQPTPTPAPVEQGAPIPVGPGTPPPGAAPVTDAPPIATANAPGAVSVTPPPGQVDPTSPQVSVPQASMPPAQPTQPAVVDAGNQAPPASGPPGQSPYPTGPNENIPDRYRTADAQAAAPPAGAAPPGDFTSAFDTARRELEVGQLASALEKLSAWYDSPQLTPAEHQQLNQLLDQVAGTVVYSTQHLLEPPYEVQPNERLEDIAQKYNVPWELLGKINGIEDPTSLRPGERLKVIRGPFTATISLDKRLLTLQLANGSYAGRFNIGIGREHPPREGVFAVSDKVKDPVYHGADRAVAAGDPSNPLGQRWIGLGSDLGIHGTDRPENVGRADLSGSVSLTPRDVSDVFDILSVGSKVVIRR